MVDQEYVAVKKMHPSTISVTDLTLGDLISNARGGKTCSFPKPIKLTLQGATTPFEISSFDGVSDRKSLDLRSTPDLCSFCERLDKQLLGQAAKISCKAEGYKSLLKPQKEGYDPLFRTKLTLTNAGKTSVNIFDETKRRLCDSEISEIVWRDCVMNVLLSIRGCYVQSGQWGPLAHVEAIMVKRGDECPFGGSDTECII